MMNIVIADDIVSIDVLSTGTIAGQQNTTSTQLRHFIIVDAYVLSMQIQSDGSSPAMDEDAVLNTTVFSTTEADQGRGFIKAFPVML